MYCLNEILNKCITLTSSYFCSLSSGWKTSCGTLNLAPQRPSQPLVKSWTNPLRWRWVQDIYPQQCPVLLDSKCCNYIQPHSRSFNCVYGQYVHWILPSTNCDSLMQLATVSTVNLRLLLRSQRWGNMSELLSESKQWQTTSVDSVPSMWKFHSGQYLWFDVHQGRF